MINSWSLLYDELYGDDEMTEDNTITPQESDEYDPKPQSDSDGADWNDPIITVGSGNTASVDTLNINIPAGFGAADTISLDTTHLTSGMGTDLIDFGGYTGTVYDDFIYHDSEPTTIPVPEGLNSVISGGGSKPEPDLGYKSQKYQEDKGIKDLKDYVSSTYRGHYTNKNSDTQTLDLIHSVGDAESFCRSNALKYLSRYDKKGTAKQDILKAMHYCLLLYYFSGNTKEPDYTNTRYETF